MFFLVVVFGMFHGLVFLPVILSTLGSPAYHHATAAKSDQEVKPEGEAVDPDGAHPMQPLEDDRLETVDSAAVEDSEMNGHTEVVLIATLL